jgi:hypothetical protein
LPGIFKWITGNIEDRGRSSRRIGCWRVSSFGWEWDCSRRWKKKGNQRRQNQQGRRWDVAIEMTVSKRLDRFWKERWSKRIEKVGGRGGRREAIWQIWIEDKMGEEMFTSISGKLGSFDLGDGSGETKSRDCSRFWTWNHSTIRSESNPVYSSALAPDYTGDRIRKVVPNFLGSKLFETKDHPYLRTGSALLDDESGVSVWASEKTFLLDKLLRKLQAGDI